jgi:hypothetical protein
MMDAQSLIEQHITRMVTAVEESPEGHLGWGLRLRLWCLMNEAFAEDASHRYTVLGYLTVSPLATYWRRDLLLESTSALVLQLLEDFPGWTLELLRKSLLRDNVSCEQLIKWRSTLFDLHWDGGVNDLASQAFLAAVLQVTSRIQYPRAAAYARDLIDDELEGADIDSDDVMLSVDDLTVGRDPLMCDYEYWGAYIVSVRPDQTHDVERRRSFWLTWLKEHLPRVLASTDALQAALQPRCP